MTGPNGAGKSTLVHLLMRLIVPATGTILVDGTDISKVELASLRRQIGLVAQHTLLLNGTVPENIAYGSPYVQQEQLFRAARAARADEFIEQLPEGYETVIGDQGIRLSGGQRQRVSLARTLLKDLPILVLDEATSMFDPEGEASFIEESKELLQNRTVILITHRPASLALADRIFQMSLPPEEEKYCGDMSGIAGIIHFDGKPVDTGQVVAMTSAISHRGLDGINHLDQWNCGTWTMHAAYNAGITRGEATCCQ